MLERWRAAGLMVPTVLTVLMLPVLIGLGTWQVQRKAWKEDLIARLDARRAAEPVSYAQALSQYVKSGDVEYLRVRVTGAFDHGEERHLYDPRTQSQGWDVFTLMRPLGGLPPIFINRGWVPDDLKDVSKRAAGQLSGDVTVTGLVRLPQPGNLFTPANDTAGNRWFSRNLDEMAWGPKGQPEPLQLNATKEQAYAPFSIDAEATPENPGGWPKGGTTPLNIPNSHLQYIVTWYGLALTLVGVYVAYARQRLRETPPPRN